nr:hypothetical protein HAGR004_01540 [Bdellovibrio sp. HAGR004]
MRFAFLIFFALLGLNANANDIAPKVDTDQIRFAGDFDREAIRRSVKAHKTKFQLCKSTQSSIDFSVEFQIDQKGKARAIANNGYPLPSDNALDCVSKALGEIQFPVPASDSTDSVILPIRYDEAKTVTVVQNQKSSVPDTDKNLSESEADKKNLEYLEQVKANALREMNAQAAKQNAQLKAALACNDRSLSLEARNQCLDQAKYGGLSESAKTCHKNCDSQRMNLEVSCQRCGGGTVARQNCISSCQRNIASQIDQCKTGCR